MKLEWLLVAFILAILFSGCAPKRYLISDGTKYYPVKKCSVIRPDGTCILVLREKFIP